MMNRLFILALGLLVSSCSLVEKYQRPALSLPDKWNQLTAKPEQQKIGTGKWWLRFNDQVLNDLINESFRTNADILTAMTNVSKARAQLNLNEAQRLPEIDLQGAASRTKNSKEVKSMSSQTNSQTMSKSFSLGAVLNYEIDLWGAVASATSAARASLLAAENNKIAVQLTVATNVATAYFNLIALDKKISLTKSLIALQRETYELNKKLSKAGVGDALTLSEAESSLASTEAQLPPLQQQLEEQESAMAILLGRSPRDIVNGKVNRNNALAAVPPIVPEILPSELLNQRPDISAAEQNLIAAHMEIGVAKAAYFPTVSLTGLLGLGSNNYHSLFNSSAKTWQTGGSLTGPIIDFGKTSANYKIAKITKEQYLIQYQSAIQTAFQEVIDSLSAIQTSADNFKSLQRNEQALKVITKLTRQRYKHGTSDYLSVLAAEQNLLQTRINEIDVKLNQLTAAVNLFHALGGDWQDKNTLY